MAQVDVAALTKQELGDYLSTSVVEGDAVFVHFWLGEIRSRGMLESSDGRAPEGLTIKPGQARHLLTLSSDDAAQWLDDNLGDSLPDPQHCTGAGPLAPPSLIARGPGTCSPNPGAPRPPVRDRSPPPPPTNPFLLNPPFAPPLPSDARQMQHEIRLRISGFPLKVSVREMQQLLAHAGISWRELYLVPSNSGRTNTILFTVNSSSDFHRVRDRLHRSTMLGNSLEVERCLPEPQPHHPVVLISGLKAQTTAVEVANVLRSAKYGTYDYRLRGYGEATCRAPSPASAEEVVRFAHGRVIRGAPVEAMWYAPGERVGSSGGEADRPFEDGGGKRD
ncbi:hypothetical protein JCM10213_006020 [Rhodosporidiobolus nylandii]